jgi:acetyl esterase
MPLDPQLQPILDLMDGELRVDDKTPEEARAYTSQATAPRDDTGLASVDDLEVGGADGMLPARIYRPSGAIPKGPVVVFFHGGGWVIGSIQSHDNTAGRLAAESGCTVISVEYRLAPEHKFPAPLEDAYAATAWVAEHADELGVDATRLAVAGDSAGGNLAAAVALLARDREGPAIAYQLLIYPVTELGVQSASRIENGDKPYLLSSRAMDWFEDHYVGGVEGVDWRAAPLRAEDLSGLPPAFVVTAELDPLRDEGEAYADRLRQAGVKVNVHRAEGMIHGFFGFPIDVAAKVRQVVTDTMRSVLRP